MASLLVFLILGCVQKINSAVIREVTPPTVCDEPECPTGCTIVNSDNSSCAVCECEKITEKDVEDNEKNYDYEEESENYLANCTMKLQSANEVVASYYKVKWTTNETCEGLFNQYKDGLYKDGASDNETEIFEGFKLSLKCMTKTFYIKEMARYFGLKVNVTCLEFDEDEEIIQYDQPVLCKLGQYFASQVSSDFNLKVTHTCDENNGEASGSNYEKLNNFMTSVVKKESTEENKNSKNCKLKKFVGAYKMTNLNSKENTDCEDDDEEEEDDVIVNSSNQEPEKIKESANCKLKKFVSAYKMTNLNSKENTDCEDEEEKENDDVEVDNNDNDNPASENNKSSTNCKLRKFIGAYKVKNLNSGETEDCEENDEEEKDDTHVNNETHVPDVNETHVPDVNETHVPDVNETHVPDVNETHVSDVNETHFPDVNKPKANCKLRKFIGAYKVKNLNLEVDEECEDYEDEEDDDVINAGNQNPVEIKVQEMMTGNKDDGATTTGSVDEQETTKINSEDKIVEKKETTTVVDVIETTEIIDKEETKKKNDLQCKLRKFIASQIIKNFNTKSIVDCDNEEEEEVEEEKDNEEDYDEE